MMMMMMMMMKFAYIEIKFELQLLVWTPIVSIDQNLSGTPRIEMLVSNLIQNFDFVMNGQ
jgi:hypothetical protein